MNKKLSYLIKEERFPMLGIIVYAFPGSGKTTLCKGRSNMIDLESSDFQWLVDKSDGKSTEERKGLNKIKNPEWPDNYYAAIDKARKKYDYVFTSVVGSEYAAKMGYEFYLAYPSATLKDEYIQRMRDRGNPESFVKLISDNYEKWTTEMGNNKDASKKLVINKGYLQDVFNKHNLI